MIRKRASLAGAMAVALSLMSANVCAQGAPSPEAARADLMARFSLTAPGLDLTADQKTRIDQELDVYTAESRRIRGNSRSQLSDQQNAELTAVRTAASQKIGTILNEQQRRVWNAAMAQRRATPATGGASRNAAGGANRSAAPAPSGGRSDSGSSRPRGPR